MTEPQQVVNQKRVLPGVSSDGGRWTAELLEENDPMKLYDRGTGTCFNPPMSSTAAHALTFWGNVEIPDTTIAKARNLFNARQKQDFLDHLRVVTNKHLDAWDAANPRPKHSDSRQMKWEADRQEEEGRHMEAIAQSEADQFFTTDNPQSMGSIDAQQIVRAWFMLRHGPSSERFPDESEKLDNHIVELYEGSEKAATLVKRYRLYRFADEIQAVPDPASDAIHQMHDALAGILNGISDDMSRTADAVEVEEL